MGIPLLYFFGSPIYPVLTAKLISNPNLAVVLTRTGTVTGRLWLLKGGGDPAWEITFSPFLPGLNGHFPFGQAVESDRI